MFGAIPNVDQSKAINEVQQYLKLIAKNNK